MNKIAEKYEKRKTIRMTLLTILLGAGLILGCTACGKDAAQEQVGKEQQTEQEKNYGKDEENGQDKPAQSQQADQILETPEHYESLMQAWQSMQQRAALPIGNKLIEGKYYVSTSNIGQGIYDPSTEEWTAVPSQELNFWKTYYKNEAFYVLIDDPKEPRGLEKRDLDNNKVASWLDGDAFSAIAGLYGFLSDGTLVAQRTFGVTLLAPDFTDYKWIDYLPVEKADGSTGEVDLETYATKRISFFGIGNDDRLYYYMDNELYYVDPANPVKYIQYEFSEPVTLKSEDGIIYGQYLLCEEGLYDMVQGKLVYPGVNFSINGSLVWGDSSDTKVYYLGNNYHLVVYEDKLYRVQLPMENCNIKGILADLEPLASWMNGGNIIINGEYYVAFGYCDTIPGKNNAYYLCRFGQPEEDRILLYAY